jgi:hypothetical protein
MYSILLPVLLTPISAVNADVRGHYVEARTHDVYTGECFANADTGLTGKNAVLAWKVDSGAFDGTRIDGLGVVAVISARETLGLKQSAPGRAIVIVDEKATPSQRDALVAFVKAQTGELTHEVVAVRFAPIELTICPCEGDACATLSAGAVKVETRCIDADHDRACGNEIALYPPLAAGVKAKAAMATEHSFTGAGLNENWHDTNRRGAYVGTFVTR